MLTPAAAPLPVALLDPNFSADPIAEALLRRGHYVWRLGITERDAEQTSLGGRCRIAEVDYQNSVSIAQWAQAQGVQTVIPGCTDMSFWSTVRVNNLARGQTIARDRPNLSSLETKGHLRRFLASVGVRIPREVDPAYFTGASKGTKSPIIVKPVDMYSGIGVELLSSPTSNEVARAVRRAAHFSESGVAIVEEWVGGPNYGFTVFFERGQVVGSVLVREFINSDWRVFASFVEEEDEALSKAMIEIAQVIGQSLGKIMGLLHIQFIASKTGPVVLEVVERMPGDLYSLLAESAVPDFVDRFLDGFLPERRNRALLSNKSGSHLLRFTLTMEEADYLKKVKGSVPGLASSSSLRTFSNGSGEAERAVTFLASQAGVSKIELVELVIAMLGKQEAPTGDQ